MVNKYSLIIYIYSLTLIFLLCHPNRSIWLIKLLLIDGLWLIDLDIGFPNGNVGRYYHRIVVNETIICIIKRFVVEGE